MQISPVPMRAEPHIARNQGAVSIKNIHLAYVITLLACALVVAVAYFSPIGTPLRSLGALSIALGGVGAVSLVVFSALVRSYEQRDNELHALHAALSLSESMYRSLTEMLPVGVFTAAADGIYAFANPRYCDIAGLDKSDLQTLEWLRQVHPEDEGQTRKLWASLVESGTPLATECRLVRTDGSVIWVNLQARRQNGLEAAQRGYVFACTDITANKESEQKIQQMAFYDSLTGLPNRRLLLDRLQQAVTGAKRKGNGGALLFLDLDNFKILNDTMGHDKGDLLLRQVANRLKGCVREGDTVARLGGDEFEAVLENLGSKSEIAARQAETVGEKILRQLNEPYFLEGLEHHSTPSIGITLFDNAPEQVDELMKRADMAMYQAKAAGRNTLQFFDPEMQAVVAARAALEAEMREGLASNQFSLHYQPQVDGIGKIHGAEAFVRWQHPVRGMVSPATFIPLAEETGLINPLGHWLLESACSQLASWALNTKTADLTLTVKLSSHQFRQQSFVDEVTEILRNTGAKPQLLKLEVNENLLVANVEDIIAKTNALSEKGIGFSLADLGTGYSSLSHLKRLSLEQLRIDQTFVRGLLTNSNDAAVTKSIFALAESLNLKVSAEGVETREQLEVLAGQGCHVYQGYLFSQPLKAQAFEELLDTQ